MAEPFTAVLCSRESPATGKTYDGNLAGRHGDQLLYAVFFTVYLARINGMAVYAGVYCFLQWLCGAAGMLSAG